MTGRKKVHFLACGEHVQELTKRRRPQACEVISDSYVCGIYGNQGHFHLLSLTILPVQQTWEVHQCEQNESLLKTLHIKTYI